MTIKRVLGLGTYPIVKPVHGGQRRVHAFKQFYRTLGIEYVYACVYSGAHYSRPFVSDLDVPFVKPLDLDGLPHFDLPFLDDMFSGSQVERHDATLRHFLRIVDRVDPDALQVEQAFAWPLARKLMEAHPDRFRLIYSSHNIEAPLKGAILERNGVSAPVAMEVMSAVEAIEQECCTAASLVVCVSDVDCRYYRNWKAPEYIVVVPNGAERPPAEAPDLSQVRDVFGEEPFLMSVGSSYPPNIEGLCDLIFRDGAFFLPPVKSLAICGGMADGAFQHHEYQRYREANSARVHFFPAIEESRLWAIKAGCRGTMLPLQTGGGTNLKTAEALALGKWVVATSVALRGFQRFAQDEGVIIADDRRSFRRAIAHVLQARPLEISTSTRQQRDSLYWDRCFVDSGLSTKIHQVSESGTGKS